MTEFRGPTLRVEEERRGRAAEALRSGMLEPEAQADLEAMKALLIARAEEPERVARRREYQAFFDAAMDTLRKGTPGLTDQTRVVLARSIALKCQSVLRELS